MIETKYFCDLCGKEVEYMDYKDWQDRPKRYIRIERTAPRVIIGERPSSDVRHERTYVLCEKCLNRMTKYMFSKEEEEE